MSMIYPQNTKSLQRQTVSWGQNIVTVLLAAWLILGVFIDGFHHNKGDVDSFWTPWHALLYSGFTASAIWIIWITYRNKKAGATTIHESIPSGYGLGIIGIIIFLVGGIGDMIWHTVFGIEHDLAALLSPTHLILLVGGLLIVTCAFRATWNDATVTTPTWKEFLPTLLSIGLATCAVSFFLVYAWTFSNGLASQSVWNWYISTYAPIPKAQKWLFEDVAKHGVVNNLLTTCLLMYPVFLLMRRWIIPFGTITFLFTLETGLMSLFEGFSNSKTILIGIISGLVADGLVKLLKPGSDNQGRYRILAVTIPLVVWSIYFVGVNVFDRLTWPAEIWAGSIVLSSLCSLGLNILAIPPVMPENMGHVNLPSKEVS